VDIKDVALLDFFGRPETPRARTRLARDSGKRDVLLINAHIRDAQTKERKEGRGRGEGDK
jgi:hypothetical protein